MMIDAEMDQKLAEKDVIFTVRTVIIERDGEPVERSNGFVAGDRQERAIKDALR